MPVGSIALLSIPYYSNPGAWSTWELSALFSVHAACTGVAHFCWLQATTRFRIPRLLFVASLPQLALLPILYVGTDPAQKPALFVLAVIHAIGAGAVEPLYLGFAFLDSWAGEIEVAAKRMALVEPWRTWMQFIVVGMIALTIPDTATGYAFNYPAPPAEHHTPAGVQAVFVAIVTITMTLGILCLWLPISPDLRLPVVPLNLHLFPSYMWLVCAECVGRLGGFLDILYLTWFLLAGVSKEAIADFFFISGALTALGALLFCLVFRQSRSSDSSNRHVATLTALITLTTLDNSANSANSANCGNRTPVQ